MSRLTTWFFACSAAAGLLLVSPAHADALGDLKAKAKSVSDPGEALGVARSLRRAGLLTDAVGVLQRAFGKARGEEAVAGLRLELARTYLDQRQAKKALRECDQIHKLSPLKEQICIAEAQLFNRRGSVALPAAEQALSLAPNDFDAKVARGRALSQLGKPAEAQAAFKDASRAEPSRPEALRFLAELLLSEEKTADALTALREAKRIAPDDPDVLGLLGSTLRPGQEAKEALERALLARPSFSMAKARLGQVLASLGDLDGAAKMLTEALAAEPRQADWHAALGEVHIAKKHPDLALKSAREALKVVANHGAAKLVEAKALAEKGDIDLAIAAFEEAYGFARLDPTAPIAAARACAAGGRLTTAKAFADRATEDFPKSAAAWEALGDVATAMKDVALARQAYGKAIAGEGPVDKDGIRKKIATLK